MKKIGILIFTLFIFRGISFGISIFEIKGVISKNLDISLTISHDSLYNQNLTIYDCRFSYKNSSVNSLTPIYLLIKNNKNNNSKQFFFFATDGSKINIKIENLDSISFGKGIQISGIPFQREQNDFISSILPKEEKYDRFCNDKINIIRSGQFSKPQLDSIRKEMSAAKLRYISEVFDFVVLNKHSYFSLYVFKIIILKPTFMLSLGRPRIVSAFNLYDGEIKKSALWLEVSKIISLKQSLEVGKKAPNFYFKTDSHKNYSLYSLLTKEKMLLIFTAKY